MALYCGIDLHSTNSYLVALDEQDRVVVDARVSNQLEEILGELEPIRDTLTHVAIESTYNWYWLADGLQDHGYDVLLVNPCKAKQYDGLKFRDDKHDARWIAHMMRLGILPTGTIMDRRSARSEICSDEGLASCSSAPATCCSSRARSRIRPASCSEPTS